MDERLALSYRPLLDGVIFLAMNQKIHAITVLGRGKRKKKRKKNSFSRIFPMTSGQRRFNRRELVYRSKAASLFLNKDTV